MTSDFPVKVKLFNPVHSSGLDIFRLCCAVILVIGTSLFKVYAAEREPINCDIPKPDGLIQNCASVQYASDFHGQCISPDAFNGHSCLVMDADAEFCRSEQAFPVTVILDANNTTLDCAGGLIDHGRASLSSGDSTDPIVSDHRRYPGIHAPSDRSINGVRIRRCRIARTGHMGINLSRFFGGQLPQDDSLPQGHADILLEDISIRDVVTGVYIGAYSKNIQLRRITTDHTQRIAVYSDAGSHQISIEDSIISNNQTREAVAFDSTYDSHIEKTVFVNNREGGVNVYQNCGELKGIVCPVERTTPPNNNRFENNTFSHNGISGLVIASRQGRNHSLGWCKSLDGQPGQFQDTAQNNVVRGNYFHCQTGTALKIHDGPNVVEENTIHATKRCVPLEVSHGGFADRGENLLEGLILRANVIQAERKPRLRNVDDGVLWQD